jgi:23S rRNA (cytidine2498-2'-O)-methyltransferase
MMNSDKFYYFLCNEGSENFLKEEIKIFAPELKFSFSTKGFLTFKLVEKELKYQYFVFCRHWGEFIARGSREELEARLERARGVKKLSYHLSGEIFKIEHFELDDLVFEMIQINESQFYLGKYFVTRKTNPIIGGFSKIELPSDAPSRAYLKILQAFERVGLSPNAHESALEIGSSPGGATYALLEKNLTVLGVDPGEMNPICFEFKKFKHLKKSIQDLKIEEIDQNCDWLLVDMNLSPEASLGEIEKILLHIKDHFKGAFITLKMTKISLVERLPFYRKIILRLGLNPKLMTQLIGHKQEFLLYIEK